MLKGISGSKQVRSWFQTSASTSSSLAFSGSDSGSVGSLPMASPSLHAMRNRMTYKKTM